MRAHQLEADRREGRFYTPSALADLLAALAVRHRGARVLDPAAGAGALLASAARRLGAGGSLVGVEKDPLAAQVARAVGAQILCADLTQLEDDALGRFDAIVANPPYVRQERLGEAARALGGRADLYVYFALRAVELLRPGGRLAMVTSNAWLDTEYGQALRDRVLQAGGPACVIESAVERWFPDASVRAAVLAARPGLPSDAPVRFVLVKRPLASIDLGGLVERAERAPAPYEDQDVRIRAVPRAVLAAGAWSGKWGPHLRAPDLFFDLARKAGDRLRPLHELAELRYGVKSGANAFFYLGAEEAERRGIEPRFLRPLFKSARDLPGLAPRAEDLPERAFVCDVEDLQAFPGAHRYAEEGAARVTRERGGHKKGGVPLPRVPSLRARRPWWRLDPGQPGDFVVPQFLDARFALPRAPLGAVCDHTVWVGQMRAGLNPELHTAAFNTSWVYLAMEVLGRQNLGEGLLTLYGPDLRGLPVPWLPTMGARERREVRAAFRALASRPPLPAAEESERPDRRRLDRIVFSLLGLGETDAVRASSAWAELVERRRSLARCR